MYTVKVAQSVAREVVVEFNHNIPVRIINQLIVNRL